MLKQLRKIDLEGLIDLVEPLLESLKDVDLKGLFKAIKPLLDALNKIDIKGIVDQITPFITPESIKGILKLLANAEGLLTATFVEQTTELIGDATPVSTPTPKCTARSQLLTNAPARGDDIGLRTCHLQVLDGQLAAGLFTWRGKRETFDDMTYCNAHDSEATRIYRRLANHIVAGSRDRRIHDLVHRHSLNDITGTTSCIHAQVWQ